MVLPGFGPENMTIQGHQPRDSSPTNCGRDAHAGHLGDLELHAHHRHRHPLPLVGPGNYSYPYGTRCDEPSPPYTHVSGSSGGFPGGGDRDRAFDARPAKGPRRVAPNVASHERSGKAALGLNVSAIETDIAGHVYDVSPDSHCGKDVSASICVAHDHHRPTELHQHGSPGYPTPRPSLREPLRSPYRGRQLKQKDTGSGAPKKAVPAPTTGVKSRRVRTGCLTCRERHLKCDEGVPDCFNCRKSSRECKRGLRLNFLGAQVSEPPIFAESPSEWSVGFCDESRLIASEYAGGLGRYNSRQPVEEDDSRVETKNDAESLRAVFGNRDHVDDDRVEARLLLSPGLGPPSGPEATIHRASRDGSRDGGGGNSPESGAAVKSLLAGQNRQHYATNNPTEPSSEVTATNQGLAFSAACAQLVRGSIGDAVDARSYAFGCCREQGSDMSSVASSLVPHGTGAGSHILRAMTIMDAADEWSALPKRRCAGSKARSRGAPRAQRDVDVDVDVNEDGQGERDGEDDGFMTPDRDRGLSSPTERDYLNTDDEIRFMHVFVDQVAAWMDSLDRAKHFRRVGPYLALKSPMLLNAFLACGVRHLACCMDSCTEEEQMALFYYDTATTQLLRSLQNPDRNPGECATTAAVLNVYEIMSDRPSQRMSHIAGARALIRECGWDARSEGLGAACFWLSIGLEVLSCLAHNWQTAWDPDEWGLDMGFADGLATAGPSANVTETEGGTEVGKAVAGRNGTAAITTAGGLGAGSEDIKGEASRVGEEELWAHRIFYIVAKIANFRAGITRYHDTSPHEEHARLQYRFVEWQRLKGLCDLWNRKCPRQMSPIGYTMAGGSRSLGAEDGSAHHRSLFPNIWLIKRPAIIGRLLYHTAMILLAQTNPLSASISRENRAAQRHHAHQICGIVAHTDDRGVAHVAIRSIAIAGAVLTERDERKEVRALLDRIHQLSGWKLGKVLVELRAAWGGRPDHERVDGAGSDRGWGSRAGYGNLPAVDSLSLQSLQPSTGLLLHHNSHNRPSVPALVPPLSFDASSCFPAAAPSCHGSHAPQHEMACSTPNKPVVNPLLLQADFSLPNHPYQNWYEPPNRSSGPPGASGGLWLG